jgi:hypothetical protein
MAKISINSKILKLINDKNETYKNKVYLLDEWYRYDMTCQ